MAHLGMATLVGAAFQLAARWAVLAEAGYNLLFERGLPAHEFAASSGVAVRF